MRLLPMTIPGSRVRIAWEVALTVAIAQALMLWAVAGARAQDAQGSKETTACLKCHDRPDLAKTLGNGETLSLAVAAKAYRASAHKAQDCTDCHAGLDDKRHGKPGQENPLGSRRELTRSMQDSCADCHKQKVRQYGDSIHATLAKEGNDKAPLCTDCHDAHAQPPGKTASRLDRSPCTACHETVAKAYAQDVHGVDAVMKGKRSPNCVDCHLAHDVQVASLGERMRDTCLACHAQTVALHGQWLPNARLHVESSSCAVCHAPGVARRVNLRLYDAANKTPLREKSGQPMFTERVRARDSGAIGLDERALFSLLAQFSQDRGVPGGAMLRGRLEVREGLAAHRMVDKSRAVSRCDSCHSRGAEPFQSVVVSIARADGRPLRHAVHKEVLGSLTAMQSVRSFYAVGSTRIALLDWVLALAVGGSLAGVGAHLTMRRLFARSRARRAAVGKA